jgi:hypothetical protein
MIIMIQLKKGNKAVGRLQKSTSSLHTSTDIGTHMIGKRVRPRSDIASKGGFFASLLNIMGS